MIFSVDEVDFLSAALTVVREKTTLNGQGGEVVLALDGEETRKFSKQRAAKEGRPKQAPQIEFEAAAAFLKGEHARTFAINTARQVVENPVVLATGTSHPTMIPGDKPNEPKAYVLTVPIGKRPFM